MASSAIESEMPFSHVAGYLGSRTLARFEVVCHTAHKTIFDGGAWAESFQRALPCFEIGGSLRQSLLRAASCDDRRKAKQALDKLISLTLGMTTPMPLTDVTRATHLGSALRSANSMAGKHLDSGGGLAIASALCFRFCDMEKVAKAPPILSDWEALAGSPLPPEDWVVSEPEKVQVPVTTLTESSTGSIETSSTVFDIQIRLAYINTKVMVSALARVLDNFADTTVTFDLSCLEQDFLLRTRNMSLRLHGRWVEVEGLRSISPSPKRLSAAMASGLMCVVSFRDIVEPIDVHDLGKDMAVLSSQRLESSPLSCAQ